MNAVFASGIPATNGVAQPATCDTGTLETSTGSAQLRANFTPEVINLRWYNDTTRITVPNASNTCTYDTAISLPPNPTKPGYKFKGWKVIPGTPIEYLQSSGTQWIDTGIVPTLDYEFEIKAIKSVDRSLIGSDFAAYTFTGNVNSVNFLWQGDYSGALPTYLPDTIDNSIVHIWGVKNGKLYCDDISVDVRRGTYQPVYSFSLFARHIAENSVQDAGTHKIYYAKIWNDGGTLVRDFIPIKDSNGVACMYDKVSKQIFYNAGSGNFIAGPDL